MEIKKKRPEAKLKCASQAEILRAQQRDDDFVRNLREKLANVLPIFGRQINMWPFVHSDLPFRLIYFVFTSGMGNQTIGEEYTGIVQANLGNRRVPSLTARVLAALLECFGEKTLLSLLKRLQVSVNHPDSELTPRAVQVLNAVLSKLYTLIPILVLIHKGLFYIYGRYYSLGKRIAGIDYAKIYGHRPTDRVSWGLRLLGIATLTQCALKIWQSNTIDNQDDNNVTVEMNSNRLCMLCLERVPTTTTPCGHLFCWSCLADWLNSKPQCPYCRENVKPSRIVQIMNL